MRRVTLLLAMLMLCGVWAFAQERSITGKVISADGTPIQGVTVQVEGSDAATITSAEGAFSIAVPPDATLIFSSIGFENQSLEVGEQANYTVVMQSDIRKLEQVIVTGAFGIKRDERTTSYSYQVLEKEQLNIVPHTDINSQLAGKLAGVQYRGSSPMKLNEHGFLRIRGGQSLGDVAPIYVVDGTVINSFDINPNDVATITVLKGANATALFGGEAANGAIVITTKKGTTEGIGLELNQSIAFDKVYIMPQYQNKYAGGASSTLIPFEYEPGMPEGWQALDGKAYPDYTDDASWGPKMDGQEYIPWYAWFPGTKYSFKTAQLTPRPDNVRNFYRTGITSNTNVAFSNVADNHSYRISFTNYYIKGMFPNTNLKKQNFFGTFNYDLNEHFSVGANVTYVTRVTKGYFDDGYSNYANGMFSQWFHRDLDFDIMRELKDFRTPVGTLASWNFSSNPNAYDGNPASFYTANYWYNPFTFMNYINYNRNSNRLYGDLHVKYNLNDHFSLKGTVRKNQSGNRNNFIIESILERSASQTGVLASYNPEMTEYQEYNYELLAAYNQEFGDYSVNAIAGANRSTTQYYYLEMATQQGLNIPDLYAITNSKAQPSVNDLRQKSATNSLFASGDFGYKQLVNINWAIRNDWYSTLPEENNSLLSPAVGLSLAFSELTRSSIPWLSFGKVFGSWGKKPLSLGIYQNNLTYDLNQFSWNGNFLMQTPNSLVADDLRGSQITTYEAGLDLRFVNNRYGFKVTYYHELNDKAPITVSIDAISGFTSKVVNAATVERTGLEFIMFATPLSSRDFNWNITATFAQLLSNEVLNLFKDQKRIEMGGQVSFSNAYFGAYLYQVEGEDWGQLVGGGAKRDEDGNYLYTVGYDANDNPVEAYHIPDADKKWGSIVPKTTGGLINTLSYKNFVLNFSLDYQIGGKFFSLDEVWGEYSGLLATTAAMNDRGKNVRDPVSEGGGVHVTGIDAETDKPVDFYMDAQSYFRSFLFNSAERYIHDLTYVKLREVGIGYQLPVKEWGWDWIYGARVSLIARNPWLIYRDDPNFDPSEVTTLAGSNVQQPGTRSIGIDLKLNF